MIKQQDAYIKEISNVHTPLDRSESTNVKGTKLRKYTDFYNLEYYFFVIK